MIRATVAAILLVVLLALAFPASADVAPDAAACITKDRARMVALQEAPKAIITDLAGPQEEFFLTNLSRFEAYDFRDADIVLIRVPGRGHAVVAIFQAGCLIANPVYPNLYIIVLLSMPAEREI